MTSKIVVNNIESDSGIGSVTFNSDIELGTKNLKGHNLESTGIVTATSFSGSGASLTSLPAGNLTGTLPALDGSALTGVGVGTADSINTSGIITATAFVPTTGQLSHRNLIINGAMIVAQRGSSFNTHPSYAVDRFRWGWGNLSTGSNINVYQLSLSSSDTGPYEEGFRKYTRMNLPAAGTANANAYSNLTYKAEAQDIANSGWNYTSASSYITISFWFKCSTNQTFYAEFQSKDGTAQSYVFPFTASGNNTWTKITKTVPGNSNIQIDNDTGGGFDIRWYPFYGTDYTNNKTLNSWSAYSGSNILPDMASTWLTAGASTFDVTGVQLEVGSVATPFEHKSYQDEIMRCYRYYYAHKGMLWGATSAGDHLDLNITFPVPMRTAPSRTQVDTSLLFKNRLNQNNSTSASTYSYSGVVSPTGDFWVARPGSGDSWGVYYTTTESRGIYYHAYEGTTSYAWSAEL